MININKVLTEIKRLTNIDILRKDRSKNTVLIRKAVSIALREQGYSYPEIGRILNQDHSTIMYSVSKSPEDNPYFGIVKDVFSTACV